MRWSGLVLASITGNERHTVSGGRVQLTRLALRCGASRTRRIQHDVHDVHDVHDAPRPEMRSVPYRQGLRRRFYCDRK